MRGVVMHGAGDVRVEEREDPRIVEPTDAIIRLTATCVCGSDLWPYRGVEPADHQAMGHEYVGVVEEIGADVRNVKVGDFVVGSFVISDNTCEICRSGYQSKCVHGSFVAQTIGTQSERARIPYADGTLVATPGLPEPELIPSLLAASDVLGTGWFGAVAAEAGPGKTVAVVNYDVAIPGIDLFFAGIHVHGGPAPVRRFLPEPIRLIWDREIDPGRVFDLTLPLEDAAEGYTAMDERRAIKVLLTV